MAGISFNVGTGTTSYAVGTEETTNATTLDPSIDNTWLTSSVGQAMYADSITSYINLPDTPGLTPPLGANAVQDTQETWSMADSTIGRIDPATESWDNNFMSALTNQLNNGQISPQQAQQALFYLMNPNASPPPSSEMQEIINSASNTATTQYIEANNLPSSWQPNSTTLPGQAQVAANYNNSINKAYGQAFQNATSNDPNQDQELYQFYTSPGATPAPGSPAATALSAVELKYGIPPGFVPTPNQQDVTDMVSISYGNAFDSSLENYTPPLTQTQKNDLEYMFYNPGATFSGSQTLEPILKSITSQAQATVTKEYGLPKNYDFTPVSTTYNAMLNGFYNEYLQNQVTSFYQGNLKNAQPVEPDGSPWTVADEAYLSEYLANPNATGIPSYVAAAGQQIMTNAMDDFNTNMDLGNVNFTPAPQGTYSSPPPFQSNALQTYSSAITAAQNVVNSMPPSPQQVSFLNILELISTALQNLKQALYASEGQTSQQISLNSQAELEIALANIQEQVAGAKAAYAKEAQEEAKQASLGIFASVMEAIGAAVLAFFSTICPNPLGWAVAVSLFTTACDPNINPIIECMDLVTTLIQELFAATGNTDAAAAIGFADFVKFVIIFMICGGPEGAIGGSASFIAMMAVGLPVLITDSGIVYDMAISAGDSVSEAQQANTYFAMALNILIQVIIAILGIIFTGGAATVAMIADIVGEMTEMGLSTAEIIVNVAKLVAEAILDAIVNLAKSIGAVFTDISELTVEIVLNALKAAIPSMIQFFTSMAEMTAEQVQQLVIELLQIFFTVAQAGMSVGQSVIQYNIDTLLAQIATMRGIFAADSQTAEAAILNITSLINRLLKMLEGIVDFIQEIQNQQNTMYQNAEAIRPVVA